MKILSQKKLEIGASFILIGLTMIFIMKKLIVGLGFLTTGIIFLIIINCFDNLGNNKQWKP